MMSEGRLLGVSGSCAQPARASNSATKIGGSVIRVQGYCNCVGGIVACLADCRAVSIESSRWWVSRTSRRDRGSLNACRLGAGD